MSEMNVRQPSSEEITRAMIRKEQASQERYLNLARIGDRLAALVMQEERIARALENIGATLYKFLPPEEQEPVLLGAPEDVEVNDAGLPVPPWINEPSTETVTYDKE